ncbi:MAG: hypothetical protein KY469_07115 [Actinobacteria bacterium]|nr:hypothetical protein [Actinomycetota bacterium]
MPTWARNASSQPFRRWSWLLLTAAAWNVWVWGTRLYNLATDDVERTTGFVVVHGLLFTVSLVFAAAIAWVGWRLRSVDVAADTTGPRATVDA